MSIARAAGTSYSYYVIAIDGSGNASGQSNTVVAATLGPDTIAPSVPANVTATSTAPNSATVSWTASTDNVAIVGYTIRRDGVMVSQVDASATSFTDVKTAPATAYLYTVTAFDAAGNASAPSSSVLVTTPPADTQKPTVPAGLTATAAPAEIDLAWTAATDDSGHVAGYRVSRDGTAIATTYSPTYKDLGVASDGPHTYTVSAFDGAANTSDPGTGVSATANPPAPTSVRYTYDPADRLTAIMTPSGSTTTFTLDALGRHSSQTVGTGPVSTYSYLGNSSIIVKIESSSATTLSAIDAVGERVATSSGGSFGYLLGDLHGNGAAAFNAAGTTVSDAFAYDAWGVVVASVTSALPTPWRYQGRILESAAGTPALYDFAARSYNPGLGTFTSLDTKLGSAQNTALLNGYLYADANPATLVDPDGHMSSVHDGGGDVATQGACGYDSFATHCGNGNTSTILKPLPRQTDPYVTGGCGSDSYATHCGDGTRPAAPFITGGCGSDAYATHCNDGSRVVPAPATQSKPAAPKCDNFFCGVQNTLGGVAGTVVQTAISIDKCTISHDCKEFITGAEDVTDVHTVGACATPSAFLGNNGPGVGLSLPEVCLVLTGKGQWGLTTTEAGGGGMGNLGAGVSGGVMFSSGQYVEDQGGWFQAGSLSAGKVVVDSQWGPSGCKNHKDPVSTQYVGRLEKSWGGGSSIWQGYSNTQIWWTSSAAPDC